MSLLSGTCPSIARRRALARMVALMLPAGSLAAPLPAQLPQRSFGPVSGRAIGFIDTAGRDVVDESKRGENSPYLAARSFHQGFAAVQRLDQSWTWIGTHGRAISERRYHSVSDFVDGVAFARPVSDTNRLVAIDRNGGEHDLRVPLGAHLRRSRYGIFRERNAAGQLRRGYVSATGERITAPEFTAIGSFVNGRGFAARGDDQPLVMVDINGRIIADTGMYAATFPIFANNRAAVSARRGGRLGYVDSTGAWAIAPAFVEAGGFAEERAAVRRDSSGGWSVIRPDGTPAFAGEFKSAPHFYQGYARVTRVGEDTTMLVDRDGKSPKVSSRHARDVGSNGLVYASEDNTTRYITLDGRTAIDAATIRGRRLASVGNMFVEGYALVAYHPRLVADASSGSDEAGGGADTSAMTTYVWYELRQAMGSIMGNANSAKRFTVYWATLKAPANTPIGRLTAALPSRPRESMAPTRRVDAVALEDGESLDIEAVLLRRNRADFSVVRRNGKDRIDDNIRYTLIGERVVVR